jgi:hypothetical protein
MRIGIYTRKNNEILPSIKWLDDNGFDAFEIYSDDILTEAKIQNESKNIDLFDQKSILL